MTQIFETSAIERLNKFIKKNNTVCEIEQLTPDASTREFFRLRTADDISIACVYPERFDSNLPQIDVTNLFLKSDLPVARIFESDYELGVILHEDFGDNILSDVLERSNENKRDELLNSAISLIAKIQYSTPKAFELNSTASTLKFDEEKLLWELNFFKTHYFKSLMKCPLSQAAEIALMQEFTELSKELENYAIVLTHRDFHAANLMIDKKKNLRIIDHQDARLGSVAYDLVSLLLDRITQPPTQDWLKNKKLYFLNEREKLGLDKIEYNKFDYEFELMIIQRCLKAIGTFSNQAGNLGKTHYVEFIDPMFQVVLGACRRLQRFENLQRIIETIKENK